MASKLPQGFRSWIEVYNYLKSKGVKYQTLHIQHMEDNGFVTTRKITMRTVERNCWREVSDHLLKMNDRNRIMGALYQNMSANFDSNFYLRIKDLLETVTLPENNC